jgi:serine/threonine protein kinase
MQLQDIFLAAIEITDLHQRAIYIAQECEHDVALQKKVMSLLAAHERSGEFLEVPVLQQLGGNQPQLQKVAEQMKTQTEDINLSFLQPSSRPGSIGRLLHYEVQEVLGRGGCGIVLKAFDEKLHRVVAIKTMVPELAATSPARKRFIREARATAAIRHENVVAIYAVEEKPLPFLVMEYIDGQNLQDKILQVGPLDIADVISLGRQIARGLEAAHAQGLIHRDIKPANILLEHGTGRPKITDFGLVRSADDASLTQSGAISGTPLYMSPEQAQGQKVDHRSDLFSFGSVLYVMCCGRPPFRAPTAIAVLRRVVEVQPRPIREITPEVPTWLAEIIAKLQAKDPTQRFASATEIATALEQGGNQAKQNTIRSRKNASTDWTHHPMHNNQRYIVLAVAIVLVMFIGWGIKTVNTVPAIESSLPTTSINEVPVLTTPTVNEPVAANETPKQAHDPIVGTWRIHMGPWPYTAELYADGSGEGRFHPDILIAIKNKNNGSGPPESFPLNWEKKMNNTYSISGLGATMRDITLKRKTFTAPGWTNPAERLDTTSKK